MLIVQCTSHRFNRAHEKKKKNQNQLMSNLEVKFSLIFLHFPLVDEQNKRKTKWKAYPRYGLRMYICVFVHFHSHSVSKSICIVRSITVLRNTNNSTLNQYKVAIDPMLLWIHISNLSIRIPLALMHFNSTPHLSRSTHVIQRNVHVCM